VGGHVPGPGTLDSWRVGKRRLRPSPGPIPAGASSTTGGCSGSTAGRSRAPGMNSSPSATRIRTAGCRAGQPPGDALALPGTRSSGPPTTALPGPRDGRRSTASPGAWADPRVVRSPQGLLRRVTRDDVQPGWEGETAAGRRALLPPGKAAMTVSGSWFFNEMAGKIPDGFDVGVMNFPVFPDGIADPSTIQTGSDCFFVFNTGDLAEARGRLTDGLPQVPDVARRGPRRFVRMTDAPVAVRGACPQSAYSPRMRDTAAK
jgi:hypothetical protein